MLLAALLWVAAAEAQPVAPADWVTEMMLAVQANLAATNTLRAWEALEKQFPVPCDWFQQDFKAQAWVWLGRRDVATLQGMLEKVLRD